MELKQLERKPDFLEIYLKIGVLKIKFKNMKKKLEFLKGFENWCLEN